MYNFFFFSRSKRLLAFCLYEAPSLLYVAMRRSMLKKIDGLVYHRVVHSLGD